MRKKAQSDLKSNDVSRVLFGLYYYFHARNAGDVSGFGADITAHVKKVAPLLKSAFKGFEQKAQSFSGADKKRFEKKLKEFHERIEKQQHFAQEFIKSREKEGNTKELENLYNALFNDVNGLTHFQAGDTRKGYI